MCNCFAAWEFSTLDASAEFAIIFVNLFLFQFLTGSYAATINIVNKSNYKVWPAIFSGAGTSPLSTTGFTLQPGESGVVAVPLAWSGRIWGRTLCSNYTGNFSCVTGDFGYSNIECVGGKAVPSATLAEFTLNGTAGFNYFNLSLVDGFNLPMRVKPEGETGTGHCKGVGCVMDLNVACPTELKVMSGGESVGCKSACHGASRTTMQVHLVFTVLQECMSTRS